MDLTKEEVISIYNDFKKSALNQSKEGNIESSLRQIEVCAKLAYEFNYFYADIELEQILASNANNIDCASYEDVTAVKGRYVFIDTNGSDNHGLTQQYIRALISANVEFTYIYEDTDLSRIKLISEEIRAYSKATIYTFDKEYSFVEKVRMIMEFLIFYRPEKYFMHIMPWDVVAITICNLLKGVIRYNINATDHAFWLGSSCIEYSIEFRNYGYTVSIEKRGLGNTQLLLLPYYPMINKASFKGFPDSISKTSIKIFSGGSFYKIYGENGLYFEMVKRLLTENQDAVLLYAGTGDSARMEKFITMNDLHHRVYLLGNRNDINEVFMACDIYLATYPISGGLMSQYAAISGKPILAYSNAKFPVNFLESTICHQADLGITYTNLEEFYSYARKLCSDEKFRVSRGKELINCVITPEIFNEEFKYLLINDKSIRVPRYEKIDYESFSNLYLEVENHFQPSAQMLIASKLRLRLIYKSFKIFVNAAIIVAKRAFHF